MLDLTLLEGKLTAEGETGLSTVDPRFQDIATMMQDGAYVEGAAQVEALFGTRVYDVRLIGYYLYGVFVERGLPGLDAILRALIGVLGESFGAVGPERKKDVHTQTSVLWFLSQLQRKLEAEQSEQGAAWQQWVDAVPAEAADSLTERADELRRAIGAITDAPKCMAALNTLMTWLREYQKLVYVAKAPAPEPAATPATNDAAPAAGRARPAGSQGAFAPAASEGGYNGTGAPILVEGSARLRDLIAQIEGFDLLIGRGDLARSAVLWKEIQGALDAFDPRVYLPKLLTRYYAGLARHADRLTPHLENTGTLAWQALQQLARADLTTFLGLDEPLDLRSGAGFVAPTAREAASTPMFAPSAAPEPVATVAEPEPEPEPPDEEPAEPEEEVVEPQAPSAATVYSDAVW